MSGEMNQIKLDLINWLGSLENEELLLKINEIIEQVKSEDFRTQFPVLTLEEIKAKIKSSIDDGKKGRVISHEELAREVAHW